MRLCVKRIRAGGEKGQRAEGGRQREVAFALETRWDERAMGHVIT